MSCHGRENNELRVLLDARRLRDGHTTVKRRLHDAARCSLVCRRTAIELLPRHPLHPLHRRALPSSLRCGAAVCVAGGRAGGQACVVAACGSPAPRALRCQARNAKREKKELNYMQNEKTYVREL